MLKGHFAASEDVRTYYQFEEGFAGAGDAPVLVFSHALGANLELWDRQIAALGSQMRVLRYDTRGHGKSTAPAGEWTLEYLGQDVLQLLDALGIEKAHFCGISLGGMTAQWLGIHAEHRFHSIIAADTAARIGTVASWNERIDEVRHGGMVSIVDRTIERWYTAAFRENEPLPVMKTRQMLLNTAVEGYVGCCAALRDSDLTAAVGSIALPTLLMTGADDPVTPPRDSRFLEEQIDGAKYVELRGAHLSNVEDADAFNQELLGFIQNLDSVSRTTRDLKKENKG
jgi:3-oxoadipate enol-lactonase